MEQEQLYIGVLRGSLGITQTVSMHASNMKYLTRNKIDVSVHLIILLVGQCHKHTEGMISVGTN